MLRFVTKTCGCVDLGLGLSEIVLDDGWVSISGCLKECVKNLLVDLNYCDVSVVDTPCFLGIAVPCFPAIEDFMHPMGAPDNRPRIFHKLPMANSPRRVCLEGLLVIRGLFRANSERVVELSVLRGSSYTKQQLEIFSCLAGADLYRAILLMVLFSCDDWAYLSRRGRLITGDRNSLEKDYFHVVSSQCELMSVLDPLLGVCPSVTKKREYWDIVDEAGVRCSDGLITVGLGFRSRLISKTSGHCGVRPVKSEGTYGGYSTTNKVLLTSVETNFKLQYVSYCRGCPSVAEMVCEDRNILLQDEVLPQSVPVPFAHLMGAARTVPPCPYRMFFSWFNNKLDKLTRDLASEVLVSEEEDGCFCGQSRGYCRFCLQAGKEPPHDSSVDDLGANLGGMSLE